MNFSHWIWETIKNESQVLAFQFHLVPQAKQCDYVDAFMWKWSKSSLCNDAIFFVSCINVVNANKICWLTFEKKKKKIPILNIFLIVLDSLTKFTNHGTRHTRHGSMNNRIMVDHWCLLIYISIGYLSSYHDVMVLCHLFIYWNCHNDFVRGDGTSNTC